MKQGSIVANATTTLMYFKSNPVIMQRLSNMNKIREDANMSKQVTILEDLT